MVPWEEEAGCILLEILLVLSADFNRVNEKVQPFLERTLAVKLGDQSAFSQLKMIAETVLNIRRALSITFLPQWMQYVEHVPHPFPFSRLNGKDLLVLFSPLDKAMVSNMDEVSQFNNFKSILHYFSLFRGSTFFSTWVHKAFIQLSSTQTSCVSFRINSLLLISCHYLLRPPEVNLWQWMCLK